MNHKGYDEIVPKVHSEPWSPLFVVRSQWIRWRLAIISERGLMGWAALEASFPMLPVEMVLIPMTRRHPSASIHLALLATVFSVVDVIYSYALGFIGEGFMLWDGLHIAIPGLDLLVSGLDYWGEGLVLLAAFLPVPLSIVSMGAGLLHIGFVPFLLTVIVARGLRFYLVTSLTVRFNTGKQECP